MNKYDDDVFGSSDFNKYHEEQAKYTGVGQKQKYLNTVDYRRLEKDHGITKLKLVAGKNYKVDFLPFPVTPNHPRFDALSATFKKRNMDPMDWNISLARHRVKTAGYDQFFLCPTEWGQRCPYCEENKRLRDSGHDYQDQVVKDTKWTKRDYYLVLNHEDNKVYLLDYAYTFLGKVMQLEVDRACQEMSIPQIIIPRTGADGYTVSFWVNPSDLRDKDKNPLPGETTRYKFTPRTEAVSRELLESLPALDEYFVRYDYDTVASFLDGTYFLSNEEPEAEVEEEDEDIEQVLRGSEKASEPKKEEPRPEIPMGEPATGEGVRIGKAPEEAVSPELSREERRRLRAQSQEPTCPAGGKFGEDIDKYDQCDTCELYDQCDKKYSATH